ncbi:FecR domain-containing protein [Pseudoalteromonas sp. S2755]|uniref:FecR family protein n=1 Tax=Pseudoalteromonas sp. S2755 TaxID=2066523 RepID=UPI00110B1C01|nr:FecR domain-containing protein [Pseudoalteromonas sp. S2755]TMN33610.1 protein FpvR [Pseudoalteromonas sp. S2755]
MDRHNVTIQQQVNHWLELERQGLTMEQQQVLNRWLGESRAHQTAYQESKQVEQLLSQFSEQDIAQLESPVTHSKLKSEITRRYFAIAACFALLTLSFFGYQTWFFQVNNDTFHASYQSSRGELRNISLPDNSLLTLDAKTSLAIDFDGNRRSNKLLSGRVLFDVASDKSRPFVISAGSTKITVLGTRFSVDKKADSVRIVVDHGRVNVQSQNQQITLTKGQMAVVGSDGIVKTEFAPNLNLVDAFKQGRLVFDNAPLNEVFEEFKRHHAISYTLTAQSTEQLVISGTFLASELENFLNLLPSVLPVEVKESNNHIVIVNNR